MASNGTAALPNKTTPPNQTLYCTNLNDKINKDDLRRQLYLLFSTVGPVLDIVALKTMKMRGQAHVVFRDVATCTQAMREMQDFVFLGRPMKLAYARGKSDMIKRLDGSSTTTQPNAPQQQTPNAPTSIFTAPPPSFPPPPGLPGAAPGTSANQASTVAPPPPAPASRGTKRARDEEMEDDGGAMEESDGGEAMEESDDD